MKSLLCSVKTPYIQLMTINEEINKTSHDPLRSYNWKFLMYLFPSEAEPLYFSFSFL